MFIASMAVERRTEVAKETIRENCSKTELMFSSRACRAMVAMSGETGESSSQAKAMYSVSKERKEEHRSPKRAALSSLARVDSRRFLSLSA